MCPVMIAAKLAEPTGFMDCTRSGDPRQAPHLHFRPPVRRTSGTVGVLVDTSTEAAPTARRTGCLSRRVRRLGTV
jgi:hypothetical protein